MSSENFDFEQSRRYWRLAPSGAGKHDTSSLESYDESAFVAEWRTGFQSRFANYVEEDEFLAVMGEEFANQRILSIGSGLGFHESYYASKGARITCYDIVPTNLTSIRRISALLGLEIETELLGPDTVFDLEADCVFLYGSLMTMPRDEQRGLLERAARTLAPGGRIILMLYTWEFARATCGWNNPDQFDPLVFARASDPSVGEEHCPWSDWHDDARLLELAPEGFMVKRRQFWQHNWFVWYEIALAPAGNVTGFFDPGRLGGEQTGLIAPDTFVPAAATAEATPSGLRITTEANIASYAALSPPVPQNNGNVLSVRCTLHSGTISIGVLDEAAGNFIASSAVRDAGDNLVRIALPESNRDIRVIFSNFRDTPAWSAFTVETATLGHRQSASQAFLAAMTQKLGPAGG